jgi:hypothetical protein
MVKKIIDKLFSSGHDEICKIINDNNHIKSNFKFDYASSGTTFAAQPPHSQPNRGVKWLKYRIVHLNISNF